MAMTLFSYKILSQQVTSGFPSASKTYRHYKKRFLYVQLLKSTNLTLTQTKNKLKQLFLY